MSSEENNLRPYPIDPFQDKTIVHKIAFTKRDVIPQITSFIFDVLTFPFIILCKVLNKWAVVQNNEEKPASEIGPIYVCTRTDPMDSKFFYAVRDGRIWFKPMAAHPHASWKLFGGNGFIDNTKTPLISVSADGDNILAVDKNQIIHYAKRN